MRQDRGQRSVHHLRGNSGPTIAITSMLYANTTGGIVASDNIAAVTDAGTGKLTVTLDRDHADTSYVIISTAEINAATVVRNVQVETGTVAKGVGSFRLTSVNSTPQQADPTFYYVITVGTLG